MPLQEPERLSITGRPPAGANGPIWPVVVAVPLSGELAGRVVLTGSGRSALTRPLLPSACAKDRAWTGM